MQDYQVQSYLTQIASHTERLALPFIDRDCIVDPDFRKALYSDINTSIYFLYDLSLIDSLAKDELLHSSCTAFVFGGL